MCTFVNSGTIVVVQYQDQISKPFTLELGRCRRRRSITYANNLVLFIDVSIASLASLFK